jgi:hypothetical protein
MRLYLKAEDYLKVEAPASRPPQQRASLRPSIGPTASSGETCLPLVAGRKPQRYRSLQMTRQSPKAASELAHRKRNNHDRSPGPVHTICRKHQRWTHLPRFGASRWLKIGPPNLASFDRWRMQRKTRLRWPGFIYNPSPTVTSHSAISAASASSRSTSRAAR